jgi:hypothetical protein
MALGKGGLCRVPSQGHSAKLIQKQCNFFNSSLCRVPNSFGTRQRYFEKNIESLSSAVSGALGKVFSKKKIFAECLTAGTRQRRTWPNTVTRGSLCRVPSFCREPGIRQRSRLPSAILPSARFLTLGKVVCTRQRLCFP